MSTLRQPGIVSRSLALPWLLGPGLALALVVTAPVRANLQVVVSPDDIARNVLLGQVYPSGNLYLLPFRKTENDRVVWPKTVVLRPLRRLSRVEGTLGRGGYGFVRVLNETGSSIVSFTELERQRHPGLEYLDTADFYDTASDMSLADSDVGQYRGSGSGRYSCQVVAVGDSLVADGVVYAPARLKRPLTKEEEREVAQSKKRMEKESECTTVPAFLDDAVQLVGFKIKGTAYSVRVSRYTNPGCGGHVSLIYALDVLQDGALRGRYELYHYWGVL